jgi:hypothetical protein
VFGKSAATVVFIPGKNAAVLGAHNEIGIAVWIHVRNCDRVRSDQSGSDLMRFQSGASNHTIPFPWPRLARESGLAREGIGPAVAIEIVNQDVRCAGLSGGDDVSGPRLHQVTRVLPPGEPVPVGAGFRASGYIDQAVTIHIADSGIVR